METQDTSRLTGGEAVVEQLEHEDVDVVFGIPGVHTLDIYDALVDSSIDHVTTRHEQGAGFMADGYARATGRVGVALLITGPGLTNGATAIAQAYSDSSPLLVISSDNETNERGRGKGLLHELNDQEGVMEGMTAYSETVERVADVPGAIADAFEYLESNRPRAVHLQVPMDVLGRTDAVSVPEPRGDPPVPQADEKRLAEAADRLATADRPLLIVGGGATGAAPEIRTLVDRTGVPVVSTVAGKGVVPDDHDCSLGATLRSESVAAFAADRDFALAIGTELSPMDTGDADLPENLVHVDIDYGTIGRNYPADLAIVGDAAAAVDGILDRLNGREGEVGGEAPEGLSDVRTAVRESGPDDGREAILTTLREYLDEDAVVVNDMTKVSYAAPELFPMAEPGNFLYPRGFGTLGFSPPVAFGAAIGAADRQVVSLVGDGGFMFTVQDLATAVKYDVTVPVLLCNDDRYGVIADTQMRDYGRTIADDIDNPDFVEMARSFGAAAQRIEGDAVESELPGALDDAFARDGPTVVEIAVDF